MHYKPEEIYSFLCGIQTLANIFLAERKSQRELWPTNNLSESTVKNHLAQPGIKPEPFIPPPKMLVVWQIASQIITATVQDVGCILYKDP